MNKAQEWLDDYVPEYTGELRDKIGELLLDLTTVEQNYGTGTTSYIFKDGSAIKVTPTEIWH